MSSRGLSCVLAQLPPGCTGAEVVAVWVWVDTQLWWCVPLVRGLFLWAQLLCSYNKATQADGRGDSKVSWWPHDKCWNRIVQVLFYCWQGGRQSDVDMTVLMHQVAWKCSSTVNCMTLHLLHMLKSALYVVHEGEAVFKIMWRCILKTPVQLQHWWENFPVIVPARDIAAVFLGKATHLNYCCTS